MRGAVSEIMAAGLATPPHPTGAVRLDLQPTISIDFTHDDARARTYRWGEDGIAGVSDTHGLQNVAFAFWNEKE